MAAAAPASNSLRIRLDGSPHLHARAAWALEALLARARVLDWQLVTGEEPADVAWGAGSAVLPHDEAAWDFAGDHAPSPQADPLAFAFWWLARVEERLAPPEAFDQHGRFLAAHSAMSRLEEPLSAPVDDYAIEVLGAELAAWRTERPDEEPTWRLVLTHDIDLPWRWTRTGVRRALRSVRDDLRRVRIGSALRTTGALLARPLWRARRGDPWNNARRIERLERRLGARSTSYLLVASHAPEDGDAELHERGATWHAGVAGGADGMEFGLHGSYTASVVAGRLEIEAAEVERRTGARPVDHRFHYLRHRPVEAWPLLEATGIRTDASLGFAEQPGFRAGTAHPYRAWHHEEGRPLDLVLIPFAVMDSSFDERYLDVPDRRARRELVQQVLDAILWYDGAATLLLHNDRLCNAADDGWTRDYRRILRDVRRTGGRACTASEAAAAYRALIPAWRLAPTL